MKRLLAIFSIALALALVLPHFAHATTPCGSYTMTGPDGLTYGTVVGADGKCWLDRNLGATQVANSSTDAASYGYLYQWGRLRDGHQIPTSGTTGTQSTGDVPGNSNFIIGYADWRSSQNDNLWQGVSGVNNPCPTSFRLPTQGEWATLVAASPAITNDTTAYSSTLKLPDAGVRDTSIGGLYNQGTNGLYWSSSPDVTQTFALDFGSGYVNPVNSIPRAGGLSVRCVSDSTSFGSSPIHTYTSNGTWTKPANLDHIVVEVMGGGGGGGPSGYTSAGGGGGGSSAFGTYTIATGGGGGGADSGCTGGQGGQLTGGGTGDGGMCDGGDGGGGGGGAYAKSTIGAASLPSSVSVYVGQGGTRPTGGSGYFSGGDTSWFNFGGGGGGGSTGNGGVSPDYPGGTGGTGGTVGDTSTAGNNGTGFDAGGIGGGGAAPLGNNSVARTSPGSFPGGGGGGGCDNCSYPGAGGEVIVTEYYTSIISVPSNYLSLSAGLVGWWTMDGKDMISNVHDASGNGNNGDLVGFTSTTTVLGKLGQALSFDGSSQYVSMGDALDMGTTDMTISAWVKKTSATNGGIVSKGFAANGNYRFMMYAGTNVYAFMQGNTAGSDVEFPGNITINDGKWHLATVVYSRSSNASIYVDGAFDTSQAISQWNGLDFQSNNPFRIGAYTASDNSSISAPFPGSLDDVRIYSRALSAGEVAKLYRLGAAKLQTSSTELSHGSSPEPGLVGHWTFDGKDMISNVSDSSGSGNNGHLVGFTSTSSATVIGKLGQALSFNGSNNFVTASDSTSLKPTNVTVSAWVYLNSDTRGYIVLKDKGYGVSYTLTNGVVYNGYLEFCSYATVF